MHTPTLITSREAIFEFLQYKLRTLQDIYIINVNCSLIFDLHNQQQPLLYGHHTGQPASASTCSKEREDFVGAKFYCPHALDDGNQCIWIREKTLKFSSVVLDTLSLYRLI